MGIPSYYKKLIDTVHGLVSKGHPREDIDWLFMDFNCLIYHCLHREDTPPYFGDEQKEDWEERFLECIVKYCLKVIKEVDPTHGVFIAVDGVVPMAKMRQQRLRRFKSAWMTKHSNNSGEATWDKNSITPGTNFMSKLKNRLEKMISKNGKKSWTLSSSDEPGEGEHKIISQWRTGNYSGNFAIYGLDADLIVLSVLGQECCSLNNNIWLFREEVNSGKIEYDSFGEEIFEWFSTNKLKDWLVTDFDNSMKKQFILNYCFAMSVLGNDFLPSSLGLKIREDGHNELIDIIKKFTIENTSLINTETLGISFDNLKRLFTFLSKDEENRITKYILKKIRISQNQSEDCNIGENNWPLSNVEESTLINGKVLSNDWKIKYITKNFNGFTFINNDTNRICKEYLYGIQWIWAYYTGMTNDVCFNWFYPFNLPPLWQMLCEYLNHFGKLPVFPDMVHLKASDIQTVEQLALVLPLDSWSLIPKCPERSLPYLAPQFYPSSFSFESVGKRYFWECESMIPLPSILELKEIIKNNK
jgi:5'-3' exonuclease